MFGIVYLLILKPQMDEKRDHDALVASLAVDDRVVTSAGIHGRVVDVKEGTVVIDVGSKTRLTIDKKSVARRQGDEQKGS